MALGEEIRGIFRDIADMVCHPQGLGYLAAGAVLILFENSLQALQVKTGANKILRMGAFRDSPNTLIIVTPGVDTPREIKSLKTLYPHATIVNGPKYGTKETILSSAIDHATKFPSVNELVIASEGKPNRLEPTRDPDEPLYIPDFLTELGSKQTGISRCVIIACNVATDMSPELVEEYKSAARPFKNGIVVSASPVFAEGCNHQGKFVKFSPDGTISKDKLWSYGPVSQLAQHFIQSSDTGHMRAHSSKWIYDAQIETRGAERPNKSILLGLIHPKA
jgi:hypothetical protein